MKKQYRIGVMGLTHDHIWDNLPELRTHPNAALLAAADPNQQLLGRVESEYQARPYTHYDTMLDSEDLDAVFIYADNAAGAELTEMAASRGLHVMIEKPMSDTLDGARRMVAATEEAGVRLMINWPFAWWPQMQHAVRLAKEGAIGQIWQSRYRAAHAGPREVGCSEFFCDWLYDPARNGVGGAYMDYCCYGALLARVLMGSPQQVSAIGGKFVKRDIDVEDNAVLLMIYANGLAVSEGSWTQIGKLSAYQTVIYGTQGTLMLEPRHGGRLFLATEDSPEGKEVEIPAADPSLQTATAHFLAGIDSETPFWEFCDASVCCETQAILQAGIDSLQKKAIVSLSPR